MRVRLPTVSILILFRGVEVVSWTVLAVLLGVRKKEGSNEAGHEDVRSQAENDDFSRVRNPQLQCQSL